MFSTQRMAAWLCVVSVLFATRNAHAIINQVDGTVVPVGSALQACLDKSTTAMPPGEGPGVLDAVRHASIHPQTFLPNPSGPRPYVVTFYDMGEGAGYQNRFGWYHVGQSPFVPANRHEIFDCRNTAPCSCPCNAGPRGTPGPARPCQRWLNKDTVEVDFDCLRRLPAGDPNRWNGGPIAFYLMTPELLSGGSSGGCPADNSVTNRVYSTDNTVNDDGDYVHFLIYTSRTYPQSYYFGWEDLFRGGDNDFEDMLVRANGLIPSCNPEPEICDNRDNNCDGVVDDFTEPCSTACGTGTRTCRSGTWSACSARTPTPETCNNIDDDCDGEVDEGITMPCSTMCGPGTAYCVRGSFGACVSTRTPTAEVCNNIDDDCDGTIDEGLTRPCSTACGTGTETCSAGRWTGCTAPTPTPEVCDGRDNDCNGRVDDGLTRPCRTACGTGTETCSAGRWIGCTAPTPTPEVCDGRDNDCNGRIDDGVPTGGTCGISRGACRAGSFVCEGGMYVCRGATTGQPETCNGIDDDCDGEVDDGIPPGGPCSVAPDGTPLCMPGQLRCRNGTMVCEGGTRGTTEICDCMDNDCNGRIDDAPSPGSLCPGGAACIACQCRTPCRPDPEFPCSAGLVCRDGFCVPPLCGSRLCNENEICVDNQCVDPCTRITCGPGQVCRRGMCVEDSCYVLGCPDPSQVCINGRCEPDPCRGVECPAGQFCRDGTCVGSCATVRCPPGQRCHDGTCIPDPCSDVQCSSGQICQVQDGRGVCVPDPCMNVSCPAGRHCQAGECVDDPCNRIQCPGGRDVVCRNGQCVPRNPLPPLVRDRGIATGGGGLACTARPGFPRENPNWLAAAGILALITLARTRRRQRTYALATWTALGIFALTACRSEPYCFNCHDSSIDVAEDDTPTVDATPSDSCVPTGMEQCNGIDDDCDGEIDEGFDLRTNPAHCGGCGMRCELVHAIPRCDEGRCRVDSCDVGYHDLDRNPLNGCEYACVPTGDEVCDGRDNDCDGMTDEGIDLQTDRNNCGRCGNACRFDHASGTCTMGTCRLSACDPGFVDVDGNPANGCEYACAPSGPEVCDGRDNDCDGMVDEGTNTMTDPRNCGMCGRVCVVPNGTAACMMGMCTVASCNMGFMDDPRTPERDCNLPCGDAMGRTGPELCDGFDNDCDGRIDEDFPDLGMACSVGIGDCLRNGNRVCGPDGRGTICNVTAGPPATEVCDGRDNDCDGAIDEAPLPGIGPGNLCGTDVGACSYGTFACVSGRVVCQGGTGPSTETCNGIDDDCDGQVDEGVTPPAGFRCNPRGAETQGVCAMVVRRCGGTRGFECVYPSTYRDLTDEALCDGLDNNCDGRVDEGCLRLGPEIRLDQAVGNSIQPMITGASGTLGVVYLDRRNGNADIFFNRSTTAGLSWETDRRIDFGGTNSVQPWLAGTGSNFFAAWSDFRVFSTQRTVFANDSRNLGVTWSNPDVRVGNSTTDDFNVRVAASGTDVTVVYESLYSDRSRHINVAVSRDGGRTWPVVQRVDHAPATAVASTPAVAMGAPGAIYVVWRDNRNGATDIYFNRSLDYGLTWLPADVRMDTDAPGSHTSEAPSIAADTMDNVYVAWQDTQTPPYTRYDIYTRSSRDRGTTFNPTNVRVDADPIPHDSRTPVALSVGGAFVVVWLDDRHGRTSVYASRSEDGGRTWPTRDVRVQTNMPGISNANHLTAATSNGIVFVGWEDDRDPSASSPLDIYANYSLDGGRLYQPADIRLDTAPPGRDSEAPFVYSSGGIGHYVWVDRRSDGITGDIYYRSLRP